MKTLYLILFLAALACFIAGAVLRSIPEPLRLRIVSAGLAAVVLVWVIQFLQVTG